MDIARRATTVYFQLFDILYNLIDFLLKYCILNNIYAQYTIYDILY